MSFPIPSSIQGQISDTTYTLDTHAVLWALGGASIVAALFAAMLFVASRTKGALVTPAVPALAAPFAGGLAFLWLVPWEKGASSASAMHVFRDAVVLDGAALGATVGIAASTILILALRDAGHGKVLRLALPLLALGLFVSWSSVEHVRSIREVGTLPSYAIQGPREMHAGRSYDVPVSLVGPGNRWWFFGWHQSANVPLADASRTRWNAESKVHVEAKEPGDTFFTARAHRGPITLETRLKIRARTESPSSLLTLRVGDTFRYRVTVRGSDGLVFYFITVGSSKHVAHVQVRVAEARMRDGFRTFALAIDGDDDHREIEVVAVDGETRLYDVEHHAIGAPLSFDRHSSSTAASVASAIVTIATIGLVIPPDGSRDLSYTLVDTKRGPEGAPEAGLR